MAIDGKLQEIIDKNIPSDILNDSPTAKVFFEVDFYNDRVTTYLRKNNSNGTSTYIDSSTEDASDILIEDLLMNISGKAQEMVANITATDILDDDVCDAIAARLNGADSTMHVLVGGDSADDS